MAGGWSCSLARSLGSVSIDPSIHPSVILSLLNLGYDRYFLLSEANNLSGGSFDVTIWLARDGGSTVAFTCGERGENGGYWLVGACLAHRRNPGRPRPAQVPSLKELILVIFTEYLSETKIVPYRKGGEGSVSFSFPTYVGGGVCVACRAHEERVLHAIFSWL